MKTLEDFLPIAQKEVREQAEKEAICKIKMIIKEIRACERTLKLLKKDLDSLLQTPIDEFEPNPFEDDE